MQRREGKAMEVGFIGLGRMGKPMTVRLLTAGYSVHVYNRSRDAVDELASAGAHAAGSPAEIAQRAEFVLTALPTSETVELVYSELVREARTGQVFVDHSTVSPQLNRQCAEALEQKGAAFLDAPMSGGPEGARTGALTIMVGGDQAIFDRALPVLRTLGKQIHLCGPVGSGQVVKLVNQLLVGVHTAAISEAIVFGIKLGADPQGLLDVISTSFGASTIMLRNVPRFISRDFTPATPISVIHKDLGIIEEVAAIVDVPLPLTALVRQRFVEAKARGLHQQDLAAIVRLWEEAAGIPGGL